MKRVCCVVLVFSVFAALASAQGRNGPGAERRGRRERRVPETVSLSGSLEVFNGRIALRDGDEVYYIAGIQNLLGFVDGLREGAQVNLEGYVSPARFPAARRTPDESSGSDNISYRIYRVTKLTVNQKTYEIPFEPARAGRPRALPGYGPMLYNRPMPGPMMRGQRHRNFRNRQDTRRGFRGCYGESGI